MTSDSTSDATFPDQAADLPGGGRIPLLGFGTWQIKGDTARQAVIWALEAGYRHIDTAAIYGNEAEVGAGLRDSGVNRDEVFITTKMPGGATGREAATLQESLSKLGTDRVDLWLIHWPTEGRADVQMWQALIDANKQGLARAIGVSNYSLDMIDELVTATGVTPAVNQIEWSPLLYDQAVVDGHRERGIVLEGYSALRGGTLDHPTIVKIAERHGKSPAQVIIRWHLQHEIVVIPKSVKRERIIENAQVSDFELTDEEMATLDSLSGS
jgi:diketogulonate reductase-like aldo/keto reductase